MFGKSKEKWLKKYIKLENGVPDACTFRNVVKAIDTHQLHTVFIEWMKDAVESRCGVVEVDGKQARRTKDAKKRALHVVSAFSAECGLVLGQLACEEKSNERHRYWRLNAAIGVLKTSSIGSWIYNSVRMKAEPELTIPLKI